MTTATLVPRSGRDARWLTVPIAGLAAALGAAAVVSPAAAIVSAAGLVFVVLAFHELAAGVAIFTALAFLATAPGAGGSLKLAGVLLVLAALRRSGTPLLLKEHPGVAFAIVFLAVWALASTMWADDARTAAGDGSRLVLGVALVFVVFAAVKQGRHVRWVIWGYLAGATGAALVGILVPGYAPEGRVAGTLGNANLLAALLVPALVFALFGLGWARSAAERLLLVGCGVLFTVTIFLTQSRGGLAALAAAIAAGIVFGGPLRRRFAALAVAAATLGIVYYTAFASSSALERVTNPGSGTGRTDIWAVAGDVIADHPLLGVGAGNFPLVSPRYATETLNLANVYLVVDTPKPTHNAYLGVLAELGVVGIVAFGLVLLSALVLARRSATAFSRAGDRELELMSRGLLVSLIAMFTSFVFLSGESEKQFWLLVGLTFALHAIARRARVSPREPFERARGGEVGRTGPREPPSPRGGHTSRLQST